MSDWIFCLVRTDPTVKKHDGISFLLIDMADPGVRPRPIRLISGKSVFCETFFENVRVPASHLVGQLNKGWTIAKRLLEHERKGIGGIGARQAAKFEVTLEDLAKRYAGEEDGRIADPDPARSHRGLFDGCARLPVDPPPRRRGSRGGHAAGTDVGDVQILRDRTEQAPLRNADRGGRLQRAWLGGRAFTDDEIRLTREWLRSKANSIEGGTSEIQLNIIAKRVLACRIKPMPLVLSSETQMVRDTALDFFKERARSPRCENCATTTIRTGSPRPLWREMADLGWTGFLVPEDHGGTEFGILVWPR